jgi:hypothetical protein
MRETPSSGHPLIDLVLWIWFALTALAVAFVVYWFLHRVPAPPLWQQAIESTIHCVAGIGTGILIAVLLMSWLRLPMGVELLAEYVAGFAVGLFLFQAPCMKSTFAGSYGRAVRGTFLPEILSMNAVMAAMVPIMIILMSRDKSAMEPASHPPLIT